MKSKAIVLLMFVCLSFQPKNATAYVGIHTGASNILIGGSLLGALSFFTTLAGSAVWYNNEGLGNVISLVGGMGLVAGIVCLDFDQKTIRFNELSNEVDYGITENERNAYNSEVPLLNAIMEDFESKLVGAEQDPINSFEEVNRAMARISNELSEDANAAVKKLLVVKKSLLSE